MVVPECDTPLTVQELEVLADLAEAAVTAESPAQMAESVLNRLSGMFGASGAVLYGADSRLFSPFCFHLGMVEGDVSLVSEWCRRRIGQVREGAEPEVLTITPEKGHGLPLELFPLTVSKRVFGFLGLAMPGYTCLPRTLMSRVLSFLSHSLANLLGRTALERQVYYLNTYLNVSSMIAQTMALRDVLEAVLYLSREAVGAEAASVLLLDHEKKNFRFYTVEGPAKPVLLHSTFPADRGLAGAALTSLESEVIHDVRKDPRFYGEIDAVSGFVTRNMVLVPLIAGEEKVGVLEVLNKGEEAGFTEEDRHLLQSIAGEIAFAIRDATMFEWVVNSYCKQRQGLNSCSGCKRPLGSWTPCARYREEAGLLK
jgi:GAF domain-containing protein